MQRLAARRIDQLGEEKERLDYERRMESARLDQVMAQITPASSATHLDLPLGACSDEGRDERSVDVRSADATSVEVDLIDTRVRPAALSDPASLQRQGLQLHEEQWVGGRASRYGGVGGASTATSEDGDQGEWSEQETG